MAAMHARARGASTPSNGGPGIGYGYGRVLPRQRKTVARGARIVIWRSDEQYYYHHLPFRA
jgi:hypothetical protein